MEPEEDFEQEITYIETFCDVFRDTFAHYINDPTAGESAIESARRCQQTKIERFLDEIEQMQRRIFANRDLFRRLLLLEMRLSQHKDFLLSQHDGSNKSEPSMNLVNNNHEFEFLQSSVSPNEYVDRTVPSNKRARYSDTALLMTLDTSEHMTPDETISELNNQEYRYSNRNRYLERTEKELYQIILQCHQRNIVLNHSMIRQKALELHAIYGNNKEFYANPKWLNHFRRRYNLNNDYTPRGPPMTQPTIPSSSVPAGVGSAQLNSSSSNSNSNTPSSTPTSVASVVVTNNNNHSMSTNNGQALKSEASPQEA